MPKIIDYIPNGIYEVRFMRNGQVERFITLDKSRAEERMKDYHGILLEGYNKVEIEDPQTMELDYDGD